MEARTLELVFPEHTNPLGAAFGGFVLGLMDKVGSYAAARRAKKPVVTVAVGSVEFKVPIRTGDLLEVVAKVVRVGRTSLTVEVEVYKERFGGKRPRSRHQGHPHLCGRQRKGGARPRGGPCGC
jgi:uncharacterized protein (TIGR00369 family)